MNYTEIKGYAKINLFLEVYEKKENGYHDIESIMQSISLYDTVRVGYERADCRDIKISSGHSGISNGKENTCHKAAVAFFNYAGMSGKAEISVKKVIPFSAGLGGGSADAAAVILALDELCRTSFSLDELCKIGSKVGADVPFCIRKGSAICTGMGDIFAPAPGLAEDIRIVVAKGNSGSSTIESYRALDMIKNRTIRQGSDEMVKALGTGNVKEISKKLYNAFEKVVLDRNSSACRAKRMLLISGASGALLTGSGSAVFGLFKDGEKARAAADMLSKEGFEAFVCSPVN